MQGLADVQPLSGRHAAVTGGGRGIGASVAALLVKLGASVTIMGRDQKTLDAKAAELGAQVFAQRIDVSDPSVIEASFKAAAAKFGPVSILINNAGIAKAAPFHKTDLAFWNQIMATDLTGAFLCTAQVTKGMTEAGYGRIVNIASTAGMTGIAYCTAYCAAKHGLIGLTRSLAKEMAKTAVTVNAVCPGYTETDIVTETLDNIVAKTGRSREEALKTITAHNPQGRLIKPEEVAEAVAWLCLPASQSVTGQSILVAGGELM
jgi:NAD(P)-dependent dehydrogenase (short-subunit alcohol dehydrogenase family)